MTAPRLLIATPVYGSPTTATVHAGYMAGCFDLSRIGAQMLQHRAMTNCDLVRARSRAVRIALDGAFTHLLFWDSDIVGTDPARAVLGMLNENVDVIAGAYPRKHLPPEPTHRPPYVGMGFTLISARCLDAMWDAYYDELYFDDLLNDKPFRSVALFQLMMLDGLAPAPHRSMLGEDYSFCERWVRIGGSVHLYDGPGCPLGHVGSFVYEGTREQLHGA